MSTYAFNKRTLFRRDDAWDKLTFYVRLDVAQTALGSLLYGIFFVLAVVAFYLLLFKGPRRTVNTFLAIVLFVLVASTTLHLVTNILGGQAMMLLDTLGTLAEQTKTMSVNVDYLRDHWVLANCGRSVAFMTNIVLADAVVWWRACVLWRANWPGRLFCAALLVATAVFCAVFTSKSCSIDSWSLDTGGVYYGIVASSLSLATNVVATSLVGYKLWEHRRILKKYVMIGSPGSRAEKVLSLLVESGVVYCLIWVLVVAWQVGAHADRESPAFYDDFQVFVTDGLVPIIAIYPTLIIVLVALDRSEFDNSVRALARRETILVTIDTSTMHHRDEVSLSDQTTAYEYGLSGVSDALGKAAGHK